MPRAVPASYLAQAQAGNTNFVYFVRFADSSNTSILLVCSADMDLEIEVAPQGPETYTGLGIDNIAYDRIVESGEKKQQGVNVSFAAVDLSAALTPLRDTRHRGGLVEIYTTHFDRSTGKPYGAPLDEPLLVFKGYSQAGFEVKESYPEDPKKPGEAFTKGRIASVFAETQEVRGMRTSVDSQQKFVPGDTFFQNVPTIEGQEIYWGTKGPTQLWGLSRRGD